ncbi:xanthine dehydrogenase [Pradoshia eiseniae]|uniref:Xanthine dehydrogenase n=1 Tax=Pradoshia eiseniae TaxID=2064768 RepID=A0A2S7MZM0_9BACI|nr:XdhC/CoxI family protein [Pradoshia eiseniae]PQD95281.1 xanthine dehydrogenase [Pradoshia eiseniae]
MNQLALILKELSQTELESVLVTIIHVEGSAYLGEGTNMLIKEDDTVVGMISPGCLEEDVILQARTVFKDKNSETLVYDMADSEGWGVGNGCNGTLHLILQYIDEELKRNLLSILTNMNRGLYTIHRMFLNERYEVDYSTFRSSAHQPKIADNHKLQFDGSGYIFTNIIEPKTRLIIFGAGVDVKPLVSMASACGFHVILVDSRPLLCNERNIPGAHQYVTINLKDAIQDLDIKRNDFVVLMTHHFLNDKKIVQELLRKEIDYIGIMGTKERSKKLFGTSIPDNVYTPIGLSIGAEGPNEIAVSIMGELIKIRYEKRLPN